MTKSRGVIEQLLHIPDIAKIVPRLEAAVLQRVIEAYGLEDCGEFLALATPAQLGRVLDSDIWLASGPGRDEELDPERFGLWLGVLMQSGAPVAAEKLLGLDGGLVIAGLARHVRVSHVAAVSPYTTLDGEIVPGRMPEDGLACELGGYVIEARRTSTWDAIVELLAFLDAERPRDLHRLMAGCVRLSSDRPEQNGFHDLLHDREQAMFDVAIGREDRREERGYVAPAQARAFLQEGRQLRLDVGRPPRSAVARAHFRAIEPARAAATSPHNEAGPALPEASADSAPEPERAGVAAVVEILEEAGLLVARAPALLGPAERGESDLGFVEAHAASHPKSEQELAFLANAIRAGAAIQGRPFTIEEAAECAVRTCNLGLEHWPADWSERDLITAFQVGWRILHRDVCMFAAERLVDALAGIRCSDREIREGLAALRRGLIRNVRNGEPWLAREALDVIFALDAPAWAALRALIDECPVVHAALTASRRRCRSVDPTEFEWISKRSQVAAVHEFLATLPSLLVG